MAIRPVDAYPGQVDAGIAGYPHGRARNVTTPGAGDGTPWEQMLVNDIFGFQQALLVAAGITPSGSQEISTNSQYAQAIRRLTRRIGCSVAVAGTNVDVDNPFTLSTILQTQFASGEPEFEVVTDGPQWLQVPEPGIYFVGFWASAICPSTADIVVADVRIEAAVGGVVRCRGIRYSDSVVVPFTIAGFGLLSITDAEDADLIRPVLRASPGLITLSESPRMVAIKISGGNLLQGW